MSFAWFNHNGIWFKVHGDPGSDETRELMRKAVSDLALSKAQNINNLEIVDVNRFPFYRIQSHFGKDTIEIWPIALKEERRRHLQMIGKKEKQEVNVYHIFAFEVCDRDFIDGGLPESDENFKGHIPVPVGYVLCQPGTLRGWTFLETNNVIPMHFRANFSHPTNNPGDWEAWVESWRVAHPASTVYPFKYPDWKQQTYRLCWEYSSEATGYGYRPYPDHEIEDGIIPEKLVDIEVAEDNKKKVTKEYYDVSQPLDMQELVFQYGRRRSQTEEANWPEYTDWIGMSSHNFYELMTVPGLNLPLYHSHERCSGSLYDGYQTQSYRKFLKMHGCYYGCGGDPTNFFTDTHYLFGPPYRGAIYYGPACAKDNSKYVQYIRQTGNGFGPIGEEIINPYGPQSLVINGQTIVVYPDWYLRGGFEAENYSTAPGFITAWNYRYFEIGENAAIVPVIRFVENQAGTNMDAVVSLYEIVNNEISLKDEVIFTRTGVGDFILLGEAATIDWEDMWFEIHGEDGEPLTRGEYGNALRCWGQFRLFKVIEKTEYKTETEIITEEEI